MRTSLVSSVLVLSTSVQLSLACSSKQPSPAPQPIVASGGQAAGDLASGGALGASSGGETSSGSATSSGGQLQSDGSGGTAIGSGGSASGSGGTVGSGGASEMGSGGAPPVVGLLGAPMVVLPTKASFDINAVYVGDSPAKLQLSVKEIGTVNWGEPLTPQLKADDVAQWHVPDLKPGTTHEYRVLDASLEPMATLYQGTATTQRLAGDSFDFALIADTHIPPRFVDAYDPEVVGEQEPILWAVAGELLAVRPDFILNLGDMIDYHDYGFNVPAPSTEIARLAYLNYRRLLRHSIGNAAHFPVIGNWEGENGDFSSEEIDRSMQARLTYAPSPDATTYPEGAGPNGDYYAFTWGDALFVVLNVMTYTTTPHLLYYPTGAPDDWTLGQEQLSWLQATLEAASSKWRFLFIHHTVGGKAGTLGDSAYGRGGGQAARVGEQAFVHELMMQYGVQIFFYGHDHVFTDMIVDDIHYTLPGSAGAPWKFTTNETGYETYWPDSGYARVHVDSARVRVDFVTETSQRLHSYELKAPPAPN